MEDIFILSGLDKLYGMRYHSVVFAVALGIPVIPIDYTNGGKIKSLCDLFEIRCWSPSEFVDGVLKNDEMPFPQHVNPELLSQYTSESLKSYKALAQRVSSFSDV